METTVSDSIVWNNTNNYYSERFSMPACTATLNAVLDDGADCVMSEGQEALRIMMQKETDMVESMKSTRIGSPLKRTREEMESLHASRVRHMSSNMLKSITSCQRSSLFFEARSLLDHESRQLHDVEVKEGVAESLCLQLGYIMNTNEPDSIDIGNAFHLLSLVYQCSDSSLQSSFDLVGNDLLSLCRNVSQFLHETEYSGWTLHQVAKVLRALSRLRSASIAMIHQSKCMALLQSITLGSSSNKDASLEAIATFKNLSFYAENFRLLMLQHYGFLDAIMTRCSDYDDDVGREYASAILRNLAMSADTKIPMAEHSCLLDVLIQLTSDYSAKTKRNAVSAIGSLAIEAKNSMLFVTHGEGVILQIMQRLVEEDSDAVVRRRAARALRSFVRQDTVEILVDYRNMVDVLHRAAMNDSSVEAQVEAIEALACFVTHNDGMASYYSNVIDAIVNIARSARSSDCIETLAKTMNALANFERNRIPMANHPTLLKTIVTLSSAPASSNLSKECSASALYNLTCDISNRRIMSCTEILRTCISLGSNKTTDGLATRSFAVKSLVNLAQYETNREHMAQEDGLINCLLQYARTVSDEVKDEVKVTINDLLPLI